MERLILLKDVREEEDVEQILRCEDDPSRQRVRRNKLFVTTSILTFCLWTNFSFDFTDLASVSSIFFSSSSLLSSATQSTRKSSSKFVLILLDTVLENCFMLEDQGCSRLRATGSSVKIGCLIAAATLLEDVQKVQNISQIN